MNECDAACEKCGVFYLFVPGLGQCSVSPLWLVCVCDDRTVMTDCIILAGGRQLIVGGETTGDWRLGNYVTGGKH